MMVGRAFPPAAALVTAPLLAVGLGVSGRGELAAATAPLLLAVTIAPLGIPSAVTYVVARTPRLFGVALRRGGVLVLLAGFVALGVAVQTAALLSAGDDALAGYMLVGALAIVPTVLIAVVQAGAAGLGQWRLIAAERVIASAVKVVAIAVLFGADALTVAAAVIVVAFAPVVGGLVYVGLRSGGSPASGDPGEAAARTGELLQYGLRSWIGAVAGILLIRVDQLLFVPVGGAYELGLYAVAVTISEAPLVVNAAVRDVMFTHDAARGDNELLARASRMSTIATGAVAVAIAATAWLWLPVLFGEEFERALTPLVVLLTAVVLGNPGSVAGTGLSARGRPGRRSVSLVVACVVNVAVFFVLVPAWGAVGAAVATLVGSLIASNLNLLFLRRASGIPISSFYAFRLADVRGVLALFPRARARKGDDA
ncbi:MULTISPECIES: polysaccharide biosynthesis C-terminal domain-containing protein [unclassified Microbacterium]|uniref:lipopolysaccharide biosynthesis protein n=1 Tax=unclassified Microbacterium TaxID=2609290 RepID=UPI00214BC18F|nr:MULTISPECIES: polysaccharide biosynthesis C-terminal domain-containing protein [unclassified Microbacterium]WIM16324.1 polysaccharide biosynthesis C-terminal domain-containing protein [Microbacterium sp. zg-B96]